MSRPAGQLHHSSVCQYFSVWILLHSQRPMIARFFCRAELVVSSQSRIGILDLNFAYFRYTDQHNEGVYDILQSWESHALFSNFIHNYNLFYFPVSRYFLYWKPSNVINVLKRKKILEFHLSIDKHLNYYWAGKPWTEANNITENASNQKLIIKISRALTINGEAKRNCQ